MRQVVHAAGFALVLIAVPVATPRAPTLAHAQARFWTVTPQPVLQIGADSGGSAYQFTSIRGVMRLPNGTIVVANSGDNSVRYFGANGRFIRQVGRAGQGPGEFRALAGVIRHRDELWALDAGRPINVFDFEGRFVRAVAFPRLQGTSAARSVRGVFADGSLLLGDYPQGFPTQPGVYSQNMTMIRARTNGTLDTIASQPALRWVNVRGDAEPQEYGPMLMTFVRGNALYYGFPENFEIVAVDTGGRPIRTFRRDVTPAPVTDADKQLHRARLRSEQREELASLMMFPPSHPRHGRIYVDSTDHLWVDRDARTPRLEAPPRATTWDVFSPAGAWLGAVEFPPRFQMMEIGADYVAGVWRNADDVELVQVLRLVRAR